MLGQDSVQAVVYRGSIRWFWGDTNRPSYPLGNFHMPGPVSRLPSDGGLDPAVGVDLDYYVDENGFDEVDRKLLLTIIDKFAGGPVGVNALAASISEEADAIEDIYEPYLLQIGFLDRTPRGRVATRRAYQHFGRAWPEGGPGQTNLF